MKNILITGGAGYIGTVLSNALFKKNLNIIIVDNLSAGIKKYLNKKINLYRINLSQTKKIKKLIMNNSIDTIIHLASKKSITESEKKPKFYEREIFENTKKLYNISKICGVKNFIFSSSAAVYGQIKANLIPEKTSCRPVSNYGKLKLKVERFLKKEAIKRFPIKIIILRFFNVVGADRKKSGQINFNDGSLFSNICLSLKKKNPEIVIFGKNFNTKDGSCIRDYIHVVDLCNSISLLLSKISILKKYQIFNLGYSKGHSVLEVVRAFQEISKKTINIIYKNRRKGEVDKSISSVKKISRYLRISKNYNNLNKLVKSHLNWFNRIQ
jgi:UDP-glucose 4-epimerase